MTDIEQRAHDFAIAAVNAYQMTENARKLRGDSALTFKEDKLIDVYKKAYFNMEAELSEAEYQKQG